MQKQTSPLLVRHSDHLYNVTTKTGSGIYSHLRLMFLVYLQWCQRCQRLQAWWSADSPESQILSYLLSM